MMKDDMFENRTDEKEENEVKAIKFNINYKLVGIVGTSIACAYIMGGLKGIEIGKRLGEAKGYDKAINEISKIVRESRQKSDK